MGTSMLIKTRTNMWMDVDGYAYSDLFCAVGVHKAEDASLRVFGRMACMVVLLLRLVMHVGVGCWLSTCV